MRGLPGRSFSTSMRRMIRCTASRRGGSSTAHMGVCESRFHVRRLQGNLLNGPNGLNGRGYFDSRGFLIRGGRGIAVENDFAAGSGPARQARARLHAVVDPEPDRRIALVWAARKEGGLLGRSLSRRQKAELGFIRGT